MARSDLRTLTNRQLNDREAGLELKAPKDVPSKYRAIREVKKIGEQKRENKSEYFKGGLFKGYHELLDTMKDVVLDGVRTAVEPTMASKSNTKADEAAKVIAAKRDEDREDSIRQSRYAKLNSISLFKRGTEQSLSAQPGFSEVEKAVLRGDETGVRQRLKTIRERLDADQTHLQAHGVVDIETGKVTLNDGRTVQLHEIRNITSTNPFLADDWTIKTSSNGTMRVDNRIASARLNTEHLINFKTGRIELGNGTRIDLKDIDWEKNTPDDPTSLHLKQSAVLYVDGPTLDLKDAAKSLDAAALANRQKYEQQLKQYGQTQMELLEKVAHYGSSSDMHAVIAGIHTNENALVKVTEDIAQLKHATNIVKAFHFKENVNKIKDDASSGLLHASQKELNKASQDYARALKRSAYNEIRGGGFSRLPLTRTVREIKGLDHNGHKTGNELQNNDELPEYDHLMAKTNRSQADIDRLAAIERTLRSHRSPFTKNAYLLRKIAERDAQGQWEGDGGVVHHINSLQRVDIYPDDSDLVKARKIFENARTNHVKEALSGYRRNGNKNEVRMALYEERYHGYIMRHNNNRATYALENTVKEGGVDNDTQRLPEIRKMYLEDIITDPNKLSGEHEALRQASKRRYDKMMNRIEPTFTDDGKTPEERAVLFTRHARERARYEVQKMIDEETNEAAKNKLIDSRGDKEADFLERYTKLYSEEKSRAHDMEKLDQARKVMRDFAWRQFGLSLLTNAQMAHNSFDQGVDSTMNSIIRSATRVF